MTIQEMKERKRELGYTYAQLAKLSGVPLGTVQKVFNGATPSPRYDTLKALEQILGEPQTSYVREAQPTSMPNCWDMYQFAKVNTSL